MFLPPPEQSLRRSCSLLCSQHLTLAPNSKKICSVNQWRNTYEILQIKFTCGRIWKTENGKNRWSPWGDKTPRRSHLEDAERGHSLILQVKWDLESHERRTSWIGSSNIVERLMLSAYPVLVPRGLQLQISKARVSSQSGGQGCSIST